jgi:hypothetical protein
MMLGCDELQPASVVLPLAVARATIDPLAHTLSRVDGLVATAVLAAPLPAGGNAGPLPTFPDDSHVDPHPIHCVRRAAAPPVPCGRNHESS